jgi:carbonic anhydrase
VPEIIFDCGLGDLFVVRSAGHVVGDTALASIEFGVVNLGVRVIVVLGHTACGAINATLDHLSSGAAAPGHLPRLLAAIEPAVLRAIDVDTVITVPKGGMLAPWATHSSATLHPRRRS